MEKMSYYSFIAAMLAVGLAFLLYVGHVLSGLRAARMQTAGMPSRSGTLGLVIGPRTAALGHYGTILGWLGFAFLTAWLVFRTVATGHGPFANMYEFSVAFAWGILGAYYWFERGYHQRILGVIALPLALGMMLYEATITDPRVFSRPWKMSMPLYRRVEKNAQLLEYECQAYLGEQQVQTRR